MGTREEVVIPLSDGNWIVATAENMQSNKDCVIFCHGLTNDRVGPQQLFVNICEVFEKNGIGTIRFDFRGHGDSSGIFGEVTLSNMIEDLNAVLTWVTTVYKPFHIGIAGESIGGVVCVLGSDALDVSAIALLGSDLSEDESKFNVHGRKDIHAGQFWLNPTFYEERALARPRDKVRMAISPMKLFYGERDKDVEHEFESLSQLGIQIQQVKGVSHTFESDEARTELALSLVNFFFRAFICGKKNGE